MPAEHFDIDATFPAEGPSATILGRTWRFRPMIGARRMAAVQDAMVGPPGPDGQPTPVPEMQVVAALQRFVSDCLLPEHREAWDQVCEADEIGVVALLDVYAALVRIYGNRPTSGSSPSSPSPSRNGTASTEPSPSPAPTSAPAIEPTFGAF